MRVTVHSSKNSTQICRLCYQGRNSVTRNWTDYRQDKNSKSLMKIKYLKLNQMIGKTILAKFTTKFLLLYGWKVWPSFQGLCISLHTFEIIWRIGQVYYWSKSTSYCTFLFFTYKYIFRFCMIIWYELFSNYLVENDCSKMNL